MKRSLFLGTVILAAAMSVSAAQLNKAIVVKRAEYEPPLTDMLTNPVWRGATVFAKFLTVTPDPGKKPTEHSAAYLMYDNQNLYIALRMDDKTRTVITTATDPAMIEKGDWAAIYLATKGLEGPRVYFQVSAAGAQVNGAVDASGKRTPTELQPWTSIVRKVPTGWIAEMKIPFSTLGIHENEVTLGFKAVRYLSRSSETSECPIVGNGQLAELKFSSK